MGWGHRAKARPPPRGSQEGRHRQRQDRATIPGGAQILGGSQGRKRTAAAARWHASRRGRVQIAKGSGQCSWENSLSPWGLRALAKTAVDGLYPDSRRLVVAKVVRQGLSWEGNTLSCDLTQAP